MIEYTQNNLNDETAADIYAFLSTQQSDVANRGTYCPELRANHVSPRGEARQTGTINNGSDFKLLAELARALSPLGQAMSAP